MEDGEVKLDPAWKQAVKDFIESEPKPGDVLNKKVLASQFGLKQPRTIEEKEKYDMNLFSMFESFRTSLLENHQICLQSIGHGAYRVVPPAEQTDFAEKHHIKNIHKELNGMIHKMHHIKHDALTHEQRKANTDALAKAGALKMMVRNRRKIEILPKETKKLK